MTPVSHFYRGKLTDGNVPLGDYEIIAYSRELSLEHIQSIFKTIYVGSHSSSGGIQRDFRGYIGIQYEDKYLFAEVKRSDIQDRGNYYPEYHVVVLPLKVYETLKGNLTLLKNTLSQSINYPKTPNQIEDLEPLSLDVSVSTLESEIEILDKFNKSSALLLSLLSMLLSLDKVTLIGVPADIRFDLAQALIMLLPPPARNAVSFATEVFEGEHCDIQLQFQYHEYRHNKDEFFWNELPISIEPHRYTGMLQTKWKHGTRKLLELIHSTSTGFEKIKQQRKEFDIAQQLYILANGVLLKDQILSEIANAEDIRNAILFDPLLEEEEKQSYFRTLIDLYLQKHLGAESADLLNIPQFYELLQTNLTHLGGVLQKQPQNISHILGIWGDNTTEKSYDKINNVIASLGFHYWTQVFSSDLDAGKFFTLIWELGLYEFCLEWLQFIEAKSLLNDQWFQGIYQIISNTNLEPKQLETICHHLESKAISREVSILICKSLLQKHGLKKSKSLRKLITRHWLNGELSLEIHDTTMLLKLHNDSKLRDAIFDKSVKEISDIEISAVKRADSLYQLLSAYTKPEKDLIWFLSSNGLRQFITELERSINLIDLAEKYSEQPTDMIENQSIILQKSLGELTHEELEVLLAKLDSFVTFLDSLSDNSNRFKIFSRSSNTHLALNMFKGLQASVMKEVQLRKK